MTEGTLMSLQSLLFSYKIKKTNEFKTISTIIKNEVEIVLYLVFFFKSDIYMNKTINIEAKRPNDKNIFETYRLII